MSFENSIFVKLISVFGLLLFWVLSVGFAYKIGEHRGYSECLIAVRHNKRMERIMKNRQVDATPIKSIELTNPRKYAEAESVRVVSRREVNEEDI